MQDNDAPNYQADDENFSDKPASEQVTISNVEEACCLYIAHNEVKTLEQQYTLWKAAIEWRDKNSIPATVLSEEEIDVMVDLKFRGIPNHDYDEGEREQYRKGLIDMMNHLFNRLKS